MYIYSKTKNRGDHGDSLTDTSGVAQIEQESCDFSHGRFKRVVMPTITYEIVNLHSAINGIYRFRIDRITKEKGRPTVTEEYQLCRTLSEAQNALLKLNAKK